MLRHAPSFLLLLGLCSCLERPRSTQYDIHTLPPRATVGDGSGSGLLEADALLSDWQSEHWASLDADQDKVALSWTTDKEYITFQVRELA